MIVGRPKLVPGARLIAGTYPGLPVLVGGDIASLDQLALSAATGECVE